LNKPETFQIKRVVLIGYRGAGKTTVGKKLAEILEWKYFSTDEMIVKKSGESIISFVEKYGWKEFRNLEHEVVHQLKAENESVIDCGGGVVEDAGNMTVLKHRALVVWIDAPLEIIKSRLSNVVDRPPLSEADLVSDLEEHYQRRLSFYQKYSDMQLNSSEKTVEEICREIISRLS
jgi:shikimate kinase